MKRVRPPMPPLAVRVQVAERQLHAGRGPTIVQLMHWATGNSRRKIALAMHWLGIKRPELHHSPALILRPYNPRIKNIAARYSPNANDADSLVYLDAPDHQQSTTGRKPGAERTVTTKGSDIGLKTKFARLERKKAKPRKRKPPRDMNKLVRWQWPKRKFRKP